MTKDIKELIEETGLGENGAYGRYLREAKMGDHTAVQEIADLLRLSPDSMKDIRLAGELYQWLVEQGDRSYQPHVEEVTRFISPQLPYSETDVKTYLLWCREGLPFIFGMVAKALLSDTRLFHRFKAQAMQAYRRMAHGGQDEMDELGNWRALLVLDPRSKSSEEQIDDALFHLQSSIDETTDPYIAVRYLDRALHDHQRNHKIWECHLALECLRTFQRTADHSFYAGVYHLTEGDYGKAKEAFSGSEDKRCRLSLAYCLIHGFGTDVNHEEARRILKDYPDDAFALYLLAVSLYRCSTDQNEIPPEVTELLEESCRVGYKPADTTLGLMRFENAFKNTNLDEIDRSLASFMNTKDVEKLPAIYGGACHIIFQLCLAHKMVRLDNDTEDGIGSREEFFQSEDYETYESIINTDAVELTPLAAYSRGLMHRYMMNKVDVMEWVQGVFGFNQSIAARRWGLDNALFISLFDGDDNGSEDILRYMAHLGWSPRDVAIWNAALSVNWHKFQPSLQETLRVGFLSLFGEEKDDPLLTLLKAKFRVNETWNQSDVDYVREALRKTEGVTDHLLAQLRKMLIASLRLSNEFEHRLLEQPIDDFSPDFMEHFIGYAFFDYNS